MTTKNKPSKWALLLQEIEIGNYFNDYSEQIKKDVQEVRKGFSFPSDGFIPMKYLLDANVISTQGK